MKKFFAAAVAALCLFGGSFAFAEEAGDLLAEPQDSLTRTIIPENQHLGKNVKTGSVKIDYTPLTDEAHIYYTVLAVSYEQEQAVDTTMECINDFKNQYGYLNYKYLRKSKVKFYKDDNNLKWARYESHVKFTGKTAF